MRPIRAAVIGAGAFGQNHIRVLRQLAGVELAAIIDIDPSRGLPKAELELEQFSAAIVATPTLTHEEIAAKLLEAGIDVLVEKPIAGSSAGGHRLARLANERGRILQVGHLERFNPAVLALEKRLTIPLFFEIHRLSVFTPRSLDVDVVLDLMIHDLDIVLSLTRELPIEIRAAGISVLSSRVDIANARLAFPSGCIANLTASRVSTEKVRKLRLFQPGEYISLDYQRQEALRVAVRGGESGSLPDIGFERLPTEPAEPLEAELKAFFGAVRDRSEPKVNGSQASQALQVAEAILDKIEEHSNLVAETIRQANLLHSKNVV
ncbi:MAG: Gfo/Idh/MocA family oxidoreductase [Acidobacteriaceae bacterium]|nr:Gfo/Idh/MocA family oxidoreductase [Acidobacteriaceae bacterium]